MSDDDGGNESDYSLSEDELVADHIKVGILFMPLQIRPTSNPTSKIGIKKVYTGNSKLKSLEKFI